MSEFWNQPEEVRKAVWEGLKRKRNFVHGASRTCTLSFAKADQMLLQGGDRGAHEQCIDLFMDYLDDLSHGSRGEKLAAAKNPGGYARTATTNRIGDEIRAHRSARGGLTKTRQMRDNRLAISRVLSNPWLDELASRIFEIAASGRNPALGWPCEQLAAEKAAFLHEPWHAEDLDTLRSDIIRVLATIKEAGGDWYWKYVAAPLESWASENAESLDANPLLDASNNDLNDDEVLAALKQAIIGSLSAGDVQSVREAVVSACAEIGGAAPRNTRLLIEVGTQIVVDHLGLPEAATWKEAALVAAVRGSFAA